MARREICTTDELEQERNPGLVLLAVLKVGMSSQEVRTKSITDVSRVQNCKIESHTYSQVIVIVANNSSAPRVVIINYFSSGKF